MTIDIKAIEAAIAAWPNLTPSEQIQAALQQCHRALGRIGATDVHIEQTSPGVLQIECNIPVELAAAEGLTEAKP